MAEDEPSESNRDKKEDLIKLLGTEIRSRRDCRMKSCQIPTKWSSSFRYTNTIDVLLGKNANKRSQKNDAGRYYYCSLYFHSYEAVV